MNLSSGLKNSYRGWIQNSARSRSFYSRFWHPIIRVAGVAQKEHLWEELREAALDIEGAGRLLAPPVVRHGPFAGLRYPEAESAGSALLPKLIGSYERELHPVICAALAGPYTDFVDVGCAEGYYAVGFALKKPGVKVWAFDTNPTARDLCQAMAVHNGVKSRVVVAAHCNAQELQKIPFSGRSLIFCDCEGFERQLFSPETCRNLRAHDFLIEIHDFLDPFISHDLAPIIRETHDIQRIHSIPDPSDPSFTNTPSWKNSIRRPRSRR
jgi:hypothetical protein